MPARLGRGALPSRRSSRGCVVPRADHRTAAFPPTPWMSGRPVPLRCESADGSSATPCPAPITGGRGAPCAAHRQFAAPTRVETPGHRGHLRHRAPSGPCQQPLSRPFERDQRRSRPHRQSIRRVRAPRQPRSRAKATVRLRSRLWYESYATSMSAARGSRIFGSRHAERVADGGDRFPLVLADMFATDPQDTALPRRLGHHLRDG